MCKITIGCVIMAAGCSSRFGGNKLLECIDGRTLIARALDAAGNGGFDALAAVTQYPEIAAEAKARGIAVYINPRPQEGISETVRIGAKALSRMDGIAFMAADQPYLSSETLRGLTELFRSNPERIIAPAFEGRRGNPCIFPRPLYPELCTLTGDIGGSTVIRTHQEQLLLYPAADGRELEDIDDRASMARLADGKKDY